MSLVYLIHTLLLILAGILAISGLIVAKKPNARELIDKLMPYQALIGVALLAFGLVGLLRNIAHIGGLIRVFPGVVVLAVILSSIVLGFMFGMPQIAKWLPGERGAEQKAMELSRSLAPYQTILGLIGLVAGVLGLLQCFGITFL